jgi:hypothetical protein
MADCASLQLTWLSPAAERQFGYTLETAQALAAGLLKDLQPGWRATPRATSAAVACCVKPSCPTPTAIGAGGNRIDPDPDQPACRSPWSAWCAT